MSIQLDAQTAHARAVACDWYYAALADLPPSKAPGNLSVVTAARASDSDVETEAGELRDHLAPVLAAVPEARSGVQPTLMRTPMMRDHGGSKQARPREAAAPVDGALPQAQIVPDAESLRALTALRALRAQAAAGLLEVNRYALGEGDLLALLGHHPAIKARPPKPLP